MTPEVKFKVYARIVTDSPCEEISNQGRKSNLFYNSYSNFCLFRDDEPKCWAGAGTIMAIDTTLTTPYWYAVGFVSHGPVCAGYSVCAKIVPHIYWIKYILSFE